MTWIAIIDLIVQLLPLLAQWLGPLLKRVAPAASPSADPAAFKAQMDGMFAAAVGKLWPFQYPRKAGLAFARLIVSRRMPALHAASQGKAAALPPLDADEKAASDLIAG